MQPTTPHLTARRLWLDTALIVMLVGGSVLWSDTLLVFDSEEDKLIRAFGSLDAWHAHMIWWSLSGVPALIALPLRHRWPLIATLMAAGSAGAHLFDPIVAAPPMDCALLVTLYALAGSDQPRRRVVAVLLAMEAFLFVGCLAIELHVLGGGGVPGKPARHAGDYERLAKAVYAAVHGDAMSPLLNAFKAAAVPALLLAATWAVADSARNRRAHLAIVQARADDLEREQQQRTALAVATERGRITRELHDVVAHGLAVMVVQAQGAKAMLVPQPERTGAALTNIVTTGRASLAEMRRLLGLVRTEPAAELAPQPSLATLPELVDRVRASGTPVELRVTGEPAALPAVVELVAYRIVQEALTNTLKHATPGSGCTVRLAFSPSSLDIRVTDSGGPVPPPLPGNGLRGITERVHALGGDLRAGPAPGGGFEVAAQLPVGVDAAREAAA